MKQPNEQQISTRRSFLKNTIATTGALSSSWLSFNSHAVESDEEAKIAYLKLLQQTKENVEKFLSKEYFKDTDKNNKGWTYHSKLGWVLKKGTRKDGINGVRTFYNYQENGSRKTLRFAPGKTARIQTFGNSMTHCDQVSDYETWQNYLASQLQEPIENYGIGGYSVYQAYLRYREVQETNPGEYIILGIHPDDHFRSLDPWRSIRFGRTIPDGFTLPHIESDAEKGSCVVRKNICPTEKDVYNLTDFDFLKETFMNNSVFNTVIKTRGLTILKRNEIPVSTGLALANIDTEEKKKITERYEKNALFASKNIIEWFVRDTKNRGQKFIVMVLPSFSAVTNLLNGKRDWDIPFLEFGKQQKDYSFLDLREAHSENLQNWKLDPKTYHDKYFIGHYSPAVNHFVAENLLPHVVKMMNPKPAPYL